ncbi:MAG TPA: DegV family protein [Solirubrobacterales bacterium]|nr:DegV family protein [Solirubrobacterales bacterium]
MGEPRIAVVCDTTPYLPADLVAANEITEVSLYVSLEGHQERESEITDYGDFYDRLRSSQEGVTTSQPSVGDFISVYEPLLDAGREIVSLHLSANISGTCEAAMQARERLASDGKGGERIRVVDGRSAAGGLGMVALAGARAAALGADADAVVRHMHEAREALRIWFAVDTLEYLRRGGRIGAARALLGSTLKVKPILTFEEEVAPVERVRTRRRAFERLVEYARERHADGADGWVVQHIQDPDAARHMVEECRQIFECEPLFVSEIGPVLGAHAGPGLLGVGAIPKRFTDEGPN